MYITNIVGKNTNDYINSVTGEKPMKQLKISKTEKQIETVETTKTERTVTRTVNGKKLNLTPTENFIHAADKRLQYLDYQFELLGKMIGSQYEKTNEMVDVIETEILNMASAALDSLRNPKTVTKTGKTFAAKLRKA